MSFDEAKDQILELYKERKTQETVEAKAKELLEKGFQSTECCRVVDSVGATEAVTIYVW